jgi:hypothetical protein
MQKIKNKKAVLLTNRNGEVRELSRKDFHSFNVAEKSLPSSLVEKLKWAKSRQNSAQNN